VNHARTIRLVLVCMLFLGLCALSGCKKNDEQPNQPSVTGKSGPVAPSQPSQPKSTPLLSLTDRNTEPKVLATPPQDMFDLKAHPDASILTAMDINKLSESERQFGIA